MFRPVRLQKIRAAKNERRASAANSEKRIFAALCCALLHVSLFSCCASLASCSQKLEEQTLTLRRTDGSSVQVRAEMARTADERATGFMRRRTIPDGTGMLFLFDRDQQLSFWMKDTPTALSIAYIDSRGRIRGIYDMEPFSTANVNSVVSVRYALEVPQGWFEKVNVNVGDTLLIDFDTRAE